MCCTRVGCETAEVAVLTTGRREAARKIWIDWTERGSDLSGLPLVRRSSARLISPVTGFNESIFTDSTVLINGIYLTCDLHSPPLWRTITICCVFTVVLVLILHLTNCCLLPPHLPPLLFQSKDIGVQMHEELVKVTNELYTVSCMSICSLAHQS